MTVFTAVGARFWIGDAWTGGIPPLDASRFASVTWTEVGNVMSLGRLSGAWKTVTYWDGTTNRYLTVDKHVRPNKQMTVAVAVDGDDAGHIAMLAAEDDQDSVFPFKVDLPTGERRLFIGRVISADEAFDDGNAVVGTEFTIVLLSNVARS